MAGFLVPKWICAAKSQYLSAHLQIKIISAPKWLALSRTYNIMGDLYPALTNKGTSECPLREECEGCAKFCREEAQHC